MTLVESTANAESGCQLVPGSRSRGLRVLMVGNFLSSSGRNRSVCEELSVRLHDHGSVVLRTSDRLSRVHRLADMVTSAIRARSRYDVAHVDVFSGPSFVWAETVCFVLRRLGKPYVLTLHGGALPQFAQRWPERVRRLLRSASKVTVPSRYLLEQMRPYSPDLVCLPNALDMGQYPFRIREVARPRLIWVRTFSHIYRPDLAPAVVALLKAEFPDVRLTMLGRDSGDGSLQRTVQSAAAHAVSDHLLLPGAIPHDAVANELATADIFLNTTDVDNTPLSVMEALASGLCVVSTDAGGLPYLLQHEQTALLVPTRNAAAMAESVRRLLHDPSLASRLSRSGRAMVEPLDWEQILPRWQSLLADVSARNEPQPRLSCS